MWLVRNSAWLESKTVLAGSLTAEHGRVTDGRLFFEELVFFVTPAGLTVKQTAAVSSWWPRDCAAAAGLTNDWNEWMMMIDTVSGNFQQQTKFYAQDISMCLVNWKALNWRSKTESSLRKRSLFHTTLSEWGNSTTNFLPFVGIFQNLSCYELNWLYVVYLFTQFHPR